MGTQLPLAVHVLCGCAVLELGRCWFVRIYDQSTDRAVLYAGPEHDGQPRPRSSVRCLRDAWPGLDALLPATYVSIEQGYSFARSAEFIHSPIMQALVWARVPGDIVFSIGVFAFVWFVIRAFCPGRKAKAYAAAST